MNQIACHECDLIHSVPEMPEKAKAKCVRCGAILFQKKKDSINRTLAWTFSGVILYLVAVSFPFLAMKSGAIVQKTALITGVQQLYQQGEWVLAILVFMTCIVIPFMQMSILLFVFVPLKLRCQTKLGPYLFHLFQQVKPWSMMEIYMLGILIAMVKLGKMATIVPGLAVIAFGILIFVLTFAISSVDSHLVWERIGKQQ